MQYYTRVCPFCNKPFRASNYRTKFCSRTHARNYNQPSFEKRFWLKVDQSGGLDACWPWMAGRSKDGYGRIRSPKGYTSVASRIAYELTYGALEPGYLACHKCDNPPCCNPTHLFPGTDADNTDDMVSKGRGNWRKGEEVKHKVKLTEAKVIEIRKLYAEGYNQIQLGKMYGVARTLIGTIVRRETWKHVL